MKKIMFNDKFGLTQAVIEGRKTMTRRIVPQSVVDYYTTEAEDPTMIDAARYKVGEVVAVAQSYETLANRGCLAEMMETSSAFKRKYCGVGWRNKMFVRADLMPIKIRITDIKVERLQDISDDDCLKEGIYEDFANSFISKSTFGAPLIYTYWGAISKETSKQIHWAVPRGAFSALIDKVSGKGTWKSNPWVFAYEFELVE